MQTEPAVIEAYLGRAPGRGAHARGAVLDVERPRTCYYGEIHALKGVSLACAGGRSWRCSGTNGAGKTTTLKTISGLLGRAAGRITLETASLTGVPPHDIVLPGHRPRPGGTAIFNRLTVRENLGMGAYIRSDGAIPEDMERVFTLFPRLKERRAQVAGTLSGGEQQMLAIGRALMARPRLLLLDEPSMGLAPVLVEQIFETIHDINRQGPRSCSSSRTPPWRWPSPTGATCWRRGASCCRGTAAALAENADVRRAYLGE